MNADEVVRALRNTCNGCNPTPCCELEVLGDDAADLIERLQAQLAKLEKRIADEGFRDLETMISKYKIVMLAANEISIETDEEIEKLKAQLAESQRRADAAVEAIRQSLSDTGNQRPHLNRCSQCAKFVTDGKQRKYKYGCESLCADALKVIVACGFKSYEPLIPFADEWRGPQAGEESR